jgi:allantoate deiminase
MSEKSAQAADRQTFFLGEEIVGRVNRLAEISESAGNLTRVFLTAEHRAAADLLMRWMRDAGMRAHLDAIGNICGRYEGARPGLPV